MARIVAAMGESVDIWNACAVLGKLSGIFLAQVPDLSFTSWLELVKKDRSERKAKLKLAARAMRH